MPRPEKKRARREAAARAVPAKTRGLAFLAARIDGHDPTEQVLRMGASRGVFEPRWRFYRRAAEQVDQGGFRGSDLKDVVRRAVVAQRSQSGASASDIADARAVAVRLRDAAWAADAFRYKSFLFKARLMLEKMHGRHDVAVPEKTLLGLAAQLERKWSRDNWNAYLEAEDAICRGS